MIYKRGCNKKGPDGICSKCGERGACGVYWYKFMWRGKLTPANPRSRVATKLLGRWKLLVKTSLAKGEVGIREPKSLPTLSEFCTSRVELLGESNV